MNYNLEIYFLFWWYFFFYWFLVIWFINGGGLSDIDKWCYYMVFNVLNIMDNWMFNLCVICYGCIWRFLVFIVDWKSLEL